MKNVTVVGSGYVGLSIGVLLSQNLNVTILDIDLNRVNFIKKSEIIITNRKEKELDGIEKIYSRDIYNVD